VSKGFVARRLDPDARYGLRVTLFAGAFLLLAIPFGWLLNQVETKGWLVDLDTSGARALHDWIHGTRLAVGVMKAVSFLGSPPWLWFLVIVGTVVVLRARRWRLAVFLVVTTAVGGLLDTAVKVAVNRSRPSVVDPIVTAHGKSFPSGHAMSSTVVYGALLLVFLPMVPRRWRPAAIAGGGLLVVLIGFSRLALGVHYLSDVVGGLVLGLAWLAASAAAFAIWRREEGRPAVKVTEGLEPEAAADLPPASSGPSEQGSPTTSR
jgi:membrane-associated phospholipid phosphatase